MLHDDFISFVRSAVLPHKAAHPGDKRLDGQQTGGSLNVFGRFRHNKRVWIVHEDTHYEPLMIAYEAAQQGGQPFVEEGRKRGLRLSLTGELRTRQKSRYRYLYIYSED